MKLGENLFGADTKRVVVLSLVPVVMALLWLGFAIGSREVSLPHAVQIDELRLFDPEKIDTQGIAAAGLSPDLPEAQFRVLADCRDSGGEHCSQFVLAMLKNNPAEGRLWLEYARTLTQESSLTDDAVAALRKSYQVSAHEGWITNTRAKFALSVWLELPADVQALASTEILAAMDDYRFIGFLADIYIESPTSRVALAQVTKGAVPEHQKSFLALINKKSNG